MIIPVGYVSYEYPKYKRHEVNKYVRKYSDIENCISYDVMKLSLIHIQAEQYLLGKELTEETAKEAAEIALKKAIPLEMNGYKIEMAKVMIRRFLGF